MVAPMPTPIADILAELDGVLEPARFEDYCVNGLQVQARRSSTRSPRASAQARSC